MKWPLFMGTCGEQKRKELLWRSIKGVFNGHQVSEQGPDLPGSGTVELVSYRLTVGSGI